jgi:hypothetical protein
MSLVLQSSGGGQITIQEPTTASNFTQDLPAVTGNVVIDSATQTLTNKSIAATQLTGTIAAARLPAGSVLQVVQATYGTTTSTSSSTYSDTGLSASITPTSSTSKILIFASLASCGKTTGNTFISARLVRNSTAIFGFDDSAVYTNGGSEEAYIGSICTSYLDSPETTSATTYKVQFASGFNAASVRINANIALNSPASVITLMEIAG